MCAQELFLFWWITHPLLRRHIQRTITEPRGVLPWEVSHHGEILGHSPLCFWRAQKGSLLRTGIYRSVRWLAIVSVFPSWPQFRLSYSCVANQPYNTLPSRSCGSGIQVAGIAGTVRECLTVPTHCTCNNAKNITLVYPEITEWPGEGGSHTTTVWYQFQL